jgi:hypothetical protein
MGTPTNMVMTPGGMPVNFIPSIAVSIGTSASSSFQPGILWLATGGDIAVVPAGQTGSVLFAAVPNGFLPLYVKAISARSSCDGIVVCY